MEASAIEILFERVSTDLMVLEKTLETVLLYLPESTKRISEELLYQVFSQSRDATVYDFISLYGQTQPCQQLTNSRKPVVTRQL